MKFAMREGEHSYMWAGAGTLAAMFLCGGILWLVVSNQTKRITQLKVQAENLRDADFGEILLESADDDLEDLAALFNDMRQRLRSATHSRDYVNSILSGMNEAIIVTSHDGKITRINTATTHLLGYEESELLNTNIDLIVNTKGSCSLANDSPSGLPKETIFQSKSGESIPVSYTCSVVENGDRSSSSRIYAAQNITERQRAEKRIRFLARIDPLTKIPNRMQFQHLLQRGIARARRAGKSLCLFYIDIDHFKEINDSFGHLGGDAALETVAERLSATLVLDTPVVVSILSNPCLVAGFPALSSGYQFGSARVNPGAIVGEGFGAKGTIWDGLKTLLFYVATHWGRISAEIEEYRKRLQDQKGLEDEEKVGLPVEIKVLPPKPGYVRAIIVNKHIAIELIHDCLDLLSNVLRYHLCRHLSLRMFDAEGLQYVAAATI